MKIPPLHLRPLEAGVGEELAPRSAPLLPLHGADDGLGDVVVEPSPLRKLAAPLRIIQKFLGLLSSRKARLLGEALCVARNARCPCLGPMVYSSELTITVYKPKNREGKPVFLVSKV